MNHTRQQSDLQKGADLVLVGHGVRGPCAPTAARTHKELVAKLRTTGQFNQIRWGYLTCAPYVEDVAAALDSETVNVLPMLMCDGYLVRTAIPEKLGLHGVVDFRENGQQIVQCLPVGLSNMLADVMVNHMLDHCRENDLNPTETSVIIIGHGSSRDEASRLAVSRQVTYIDDLQRFKDVHQAFLEEVPKLPDVLRGIEGKALVIGYFANRGRHATTDVTTLMRQSGSAANYLGPVGALPAISDVVMDCVNRAPG